MKVKDVASTDVIHVTVPGSREDALTMIENGATRIGASASIAICEGTKSNSNY